VIAVAQLFRKLLTLCGSFQPCFPELKQLDINLDDDLDDTGPLTYAQMSDLEINLDG
jgi:hypothetical protein